MATDAVEVLRGGVVESRHAVSVAVVDSTGRLVASVGDPMLVSFLRSTAKPVQAIPVLESGAADHFGFSDRELAVMTASHSGEPAHTRLVEGILERIGLTPSDLRCGRHAPYGKDAARKVGEAFTTLHHNCSGKHAGMLAVCAHRGWDVPSYQSPAHPLQITIAKAVSDESGLALGQVRRATDGCGVPTFAMSLGAAARIYARLADPSHVRGPRQATLMRLRAAMSKHPELVAGRGRFETDLRMAAEGGLVVKSGAEAFYAASFVEKGWGLALKVEDGAARAVAPTLVETLRQLRIGKRKWFEATRLHWDEPLRNISGTEVGAVRPAFRVRRRRR
jgi:L-asparaginase II